jgi:hypothetical protein
MKKEEILVMMYEKGYEVDNSEEGTFNSERLCISANGDNLWFKPKQRFPIVFENKNYVVNVDFDGEISIRSKNIQPSWMFSPMESLPLLEQAVAKSKEIRGLK